MFLGFSLQFFRSKYEIHNTSSISFLVISSCPWYLSLLSSATNLSFFWARFSHCFSRSLFSFLSFSFVSLKFENFWHMSLISSAPVVSLISLSASSNSLTCFSSSKFRLFFWFVDSSVSWWSSSCFSNFFLFSSIFSILLSTFVSFSWDFINLWYSESSAFCWG